MPFSTQRRSLALLAAGAALAAGATGGFTAAAAPAGSGGDPNSDAAVSTGVDSTSAVVGLSLAPLATDAKLAPAKGKKVDFNSSAAKSERAKIVAQRNTFKKWLQSNAPKAQVTGEYDVAVNAVAVRLNGTSLSTLRNGPGVVSAGYQGTYSPTSDDPDLSLIKAKEAWAATPSDKSAGAGMKVGIVDTGIDVTHPCFSDGTKPTGLTNSKVIVAKVFANKAQQQGLTALAVQDHGTHVAGTVACNVNTPATVDGVDIPYDPSGVAPAAKLGSYNVFPGHIENARSEDILNALQAAALDQMDVINMSLGGNAHGVQDLLTNAVDNLDRAGIVVAVSAGNEGPGHYTVGSPGSAERALTAGASSVGHFIAVPVNVGGKTIATAAGDFPIPTTPLTGKLVAAKGDATNPDLGLGCADGAYDAAVAGQIALVSRGTCTFGNKVSVAEKAGAAGVIIVNNAAGDPTAMAADEAFPTTKPAVMAGLADKATLVAAAKNAGSATITTSQDLHADRERQHHGWLLQPGPDRRRLPRQARPGRSRRQRAVLDPEQRHLLRHQGGHQRVLGLLQRHLDGEPAPRGHGRGRQGGPPPLERGADPLGDHEHGRPGRAPQLEDRCAGDRPAGHRRRARRRAGRGRRQGRALVGEHVLRGGAVGQRQVAEQDRHGHRPLRSRSRRTGCLGER